jgi:cold shock CspA family protein
MMGKVDVFFKEKGYGFLVSVETGRRVSYFFHVSQIVIGEPVPGAVAEFKVSEQPKGKKTPPAVNVHISDMEVQS